MPEPYVGLNLVFSPCFRCISSISPGRPCSKRGTRSGFSDPTLRNNSSLGRIARQWYEQRPLSALIMGCISVKIVNRVVLRNHQYSGLFHTFSSHMHDKRSHQQTSQRVYMSKKRSNHHKREDTGSRKSCPESVRTTSRSPYPSGNRNAVHQHTVGSRNNRVCTSFFAINEISEFCVSVIGLRIGFINGIIARRRIFIGYF